MIFRWHRGWPGREPTYTPDQRRRRVRSSPHRRGPRRVMPPPSGWRPPLWSRRRSRGPAAPSDNSTSRSSPPSGEVRHFIAARPSHRCLTRARPSLSGPWESVEARRGDLEPRPPGSSRQTIDVWFHGSEHIAQAAYAPSRQAANVGPRMPIRPLAGWLHAVPHYLALQWRRPALTWGIAAGISSGPRERIHQLVSMVDIS